MLVETRRFTYFAYHRLYDPKLSPEQNERIFGVCSRGHGHSYTVGVALNTGLLDWARAEPIICPELEALLDHTNLNEKLGPLPTGERLVLHLWQLFSQRLPPGALIRLDVEETGKNRFSCSGDPVDGTFDF